MYFHLRSHTLGFNPESQKLEPHQLIQDLAQGVKVIKMLRQLESVANDQMTQDIQQVKASYTGRILYKGRKSVNLGKMSEKGKAPVYTSDQ